MDTEQNLIDRLDTLDSNFKARMESMESNMKEHLNMCRELCATRLIHVEESVGKAHQRLNDHKKSIECLDRYKNRSVGAISVIVVVIGIIGLKIFDIIK